MENQGNGTPYLTQDLMQPPVSPIPSVSQKQNEEVNTENPHDELVPLAPTNIEIAPSPKIQNIVCSVNLECSLDLKLIYCRTRNSEFNPQRFAAVIMRISSPKSTASIFSSGKLVITGVKHEEDAVLACRKYARIIQKLGYPVRFVGFTIHNMVATCDLKFPLHLENLYQKHAQFSSYEPELFPCLMYKMNKPRIAISVFANGKLVFAGAKNRHEIHEGIDILFPILKSFRIKQ